MELAIEVTLHGVVASGVGQAAGFTELPWAARQFEEKLGFRPWPGTFNLRLVDEADRELWRRVASQPGIPIEPEAEACAAWCHTAVIGEAIAAAVILPCVMGYPSDQVELLAPEHVRSKLALKDGDRVRVRIMSVRTEWARPHPSP